jgi:hypothetical protein
MSNIQTIRQRILDRDYFMSSHAEEEMLDDNLERKDVENAILKGRIEKNMTHDERGARYRIEGPARDGHQWGQTLRYPHEFTLLPMSRSSLLKGLAPDLTLRQTTQRRYSGRRFGREI